MTYSIPKDKDVFIPSRNRVDTLWTWNSLDYQTKSRAVIVCPEEEVEKHRAKGREAVARPPLKLSGVRQWLVDQFTEQGRAANPLIMLDDDLGFFIRRDQSAFNLRACDLNDGEVELLLNHLRKLVRTKVVHAGLSPRQMNNQHWPALLTWDTRMNAVHCVLPDALNFYGIRYDEVDMMEDYNVTLSLFAKGERNVQVVVS